MSAADAATGRDRSVQRYAEMIARITTPLPMRRLRMLQILMISAFLGFAGLALSGWHSHYGEHAHAQSGQYEAFWRLHQGAAVALQASATSGAEAAAAKRRLARLADLPPLALPADLPEVTAGLAQLGGAADLEDPAMLAALAQSLIAVAHEMQARYGITPVQPTPSGHGMMIAASFIAFLLLAALLAENHYYRRAARENAALAEQAASASLAKTRFLTMMNHELRTPMNGFMGLLALVRQSGLNPRQDRLLDQAERSGRHMTGLLGDILDYSELQSETLCLVEEQFELRDMLKALRGQIQVIGAGREIDAGAVLHPTVPSKVIGDVERLDQVLRHILRYMINVVETTEIQTTIGYDAGRVQIAIDLVTPPYDGPGWQPESVFSREPVQGDPFASDAIGPAIARGLVARMGGTISIARPETCRAVLTIAVPAPRPQSDLPLARVETSSATSSALTYTLLTRNGWQLWHAGEDPGRVALVVVELAGRDETVIAARLRVQHPHARLVAVGSPKQPCLFDAQCASARETTAFTQAISENAPLSQVAS
ncbi:MAG: HAMP domain-containing sensor histidine kinase [Pseudomonadota bacterium]